MESYQALLPDPNGQISATSQQSLIVMQQMYLQVFNGSSQPLVALADATPLPFQPSTNDIRVNVLWFSSLIFSLMTASFAILVKQWLREYMAVDYPSPQARLRIRHCRYPELAAWKVFEIAAILPLLQQLALALFFVGLCYFTSSVHESVGHTTLPLIAGWAFCFTVATFLPIFLPRCPYKTALLKSLHIRTVRAVERFLSWLSSQSSSQFAHNLHAPSDRMSQHSWLERIIRSFRTRLGVHRSLYDEQLIITQDAQDIKILASVDAIQLNDDLLSTTILESLQQIHQPEWTDVIGLVYTLLGHRGYPEASSRGSFEVPPSLHLETLTQSAYTGVIDIVSRYVLLRLESDEAANAAEAIRHTWIILLSESRFPLPSSGVAALRNLAHSPTAKDDWCALVSAYNNEHPMALAALLGCLLRRMKIPALHHPSSLQFIDGLVEGLFGLKFSPGQWDLELGFPHPTTPWSLSKICEVCDPEVRREAVRLITSIIGYVLHADDDIGMTFKYYLRLIDLVTGVWELGAALANERDSATLEVFYSAVVEWLSHRRKTMSFLLALMRTNYRVVEAVCDTISDLKRTVSFRVVVVPDWPC